MLNTVEKGITGKTVSKTIGLHHMVINNIKESCDSNYSKDIFTLKDSEEFGSQRCRPNEAKVITDTILKGCKILWFSARDECLIVIRMFKRKHRYL